MPMLAPLMLSLVLAQVDMGPMLDKGPMVLVEDGANGKFGSATAYVMVNAAPEKVWADLLAMEHFKDFMPKVETSEVLRRGAKDFDVHFVLDVPGPDTDYTVRYTPDAATKTIKGNWVKGDLKGSNWVWHVEPAPGGKSLLVHKAAVKNFSSMAQSLEDSGQTITIGLNVSSVLAASKAVKKRAESEAAPQTAAK
jgi:ribosome-associated toxin RatA of RatAB toxin-antitoxin module